MGGWGGTFTNNTDMHVLSTHNEPHRAANRTETTVICERVKMFQMLSCDKRCSHYFWETSTPQCSFFSEVYIRWAQLKQKQHGGQMSNWKAFCEMLPWLQKRMSTAAIWRGEDHWDSAQPKGFFGSVKLASQVNEQKRCRSRSSFGDAAFSVSPVWMVSDSSM